MANPYPTPHEVPPPTADATPAEHEEMGTIYPPRDRGVFSSFFVGVVVMMPGAACCALPLMIPPPPVEKLWILVLFYVVGGGFLLTGMTLAVAPLFKRRCRFSVYPDRFVMQRGLVTAVGRWEDVAALRVRVVRDGTSRRLVDVVELSGGKVIEIDPRAVCNARDLVDRIGRAVGRELAPQVCQRLYAQQAVAFGPLVLTGKGVHAGSVLFPWADVGAIVADRMTGTVVVDCSGLLVATEVPVADVPNLPVISAVVDLVRDRISRGEFPDARSLAAAGPVTADKDGDSPAGQGTFTREPVDESLASNRVPAGSTPADDDEDIPVAQVVEDGEDLAGLEAIDEENGRTEHVASSVAPVPSSKRSRPGSRFAVRFAAGTVCLAGLVTAGLVVAHFVGTPSGQPTPAPRRQPDPRRVERVAPPQNQEDEPGALPGRPSGQTEEPTALPGRTADTIDDAPVPGSESPEAAGPPVFINGVAFDPTSLERIPTQPASPDAAPLSGGAVPPDPSEPQTNADAAAAERPAASPPGPEPEQIEHLRILRFSDDSKEKDCATVVARDGEAAYALRGPDLYRIALPALSITRHRVTPCGGQLAVTAVGVVVVHNRQLHLYDDETLALRAAYQLPGEVHLMAASPESARMAFSWLPAETAWDAYRNVDYLGIVDLAEEQVLLNRPRWELTPKGRYDSYPLAIIDGLLLLGDQDLLCAASRDRRSVWSLHHFVMHPDHLEYRGASRRLLARPESIVAGPQPGQLMLSCRPWANASLAYRNTSRYATEVVSLADLANAPVKAAAEATTRVAADLETGDLYGWRPGETREGKILQRFLANGTRADAVFIPVEAGAISTVSVVPLPQSGDVLVQGANELCLVRFRNLSEPAVAPDASTERTVPFAEITANDDSVTYRITHRATLPSHPETAVRVLFSPDGRSLLSTGSTHNGNSSICQNAFLRESATGRLLHVFDSTYGGVLGGAFSPDGDVVATSDLGGRVSFWDAETGTLLNRIPGRSAICVNWIPGTERVAVARGNDRQVQVWTREAEMVWEAKSHTQSVWELDVSPDGTWIASGSADGTCKIWNAEDGTLWHTLKNEPSTWITAMAISPDGKSLAVGDNYSNIRLWDPRTGGVQRDLRGGSKDHHRSVHSLAYHPGGQILAAGEVSSGQGSAITFWDAVGGRPLGQIDPQAKAVHDIAFSPDGRTMALACEPGAVKLFDVRLAAAE